MSKINACLAILALSVAIGFATTARAEKRVALLVGNNAYQSVPRLQTAVNDARAVGAALRGLGFSVILAENQSRRAMSEALLAFDKAIEPGDVALFFFAGHGFEIRGQNYLLPTDIPEVREGQEELIRDSAFPADRIIDRLQARGARTAVLVLDACRNNPFDRPGGRGLKGSGGLAAMTPAEGVFIMFSAGAKQTALDRLSNAERVANSVFTRNLVRWLAEPDLTLVQIAKRLQIEVKQLAASVGGDQTPAYYDQVVGEIILNRSDRTTPAGPPTPQAAALLADVDKRATEAVPAPAADPVMAELDALAAAKSWSELRSQLTTVKPTARDAHWASLAEQAAIGELTPLATSSRPFGDRLAALEHYATTFQVLTDNPKFLALRTSVGLSAFGDCLDESYGASECRRGLEDFVRTTPKSGGTARADLARDAARLIGRKLNRSAAAPFFAVAVEASAETDAAVCADPDLTTAVIAAFDRPPDWNEAKAAAALTEACWKTLGTAVVAQVARETSDNSYYLGNTCPILLRRDALTGLREARCREITSR
ncbi:caspase family protein [Bradyrhizobium sp. CB3481]|uniref:caspase family protein n=1 Tax=Bradyrhizobium sp. CB3481 TaxID=3039158 RepID=UPI0024B07449|nr:caspase family protein [Bradyrhizobium sp. CB3481]WFU19374.1 caspase family protein [Bradyrhizobium sp. CB3481]